MALRPIPLSCCVSIHAFRGEGDRMVLINRCIGGFQSTPSGGKATSRLTKSRIAVCAFQSTPSGGKATYFDRQL